MRIKIYFLILVLSSFLFANCSRYSAQLQKADTAFLKNDFANAESLYKELLQSKDENTQISAELGLIKLYMKKNDFKKAISIIKPTLEKRKLDEPFKEWLAYQNIIALFNLNLYVETYNSAIEYLRNYPKTKNYNKVKELTAISMKSLGKSTDLDLINALENANKAQNINIKPVSLEIIDFYKDEFNYVNVIGKTDPKAIVFVDDNKTVVSANGEFNAKVNFRRGKAVVVKTQLSENQYTLKELIDVEEPNKPQGLELINLTNNSVAIRWNANTEKDILGYNVYYSLNASNWEKVNRDNDFVKITEYTINKRIPVPNINGVRVYIRITAVDKLHNESEPSDILEVR